MTLVKRLPKRKAIYKCDKCENEYTLWYRYKNIDESTVCKTCSKGSSTHRGKTENPRLYNIWKGIRQRTTNPNNPRYKDYGAKGVVMCEEWNDFSVFREWSLANGYSDTKELDKDKLSIEKGIAKKYSPKNCLWLERTDHAKQQRVLSKEQRLEVVNKYKNPKVSLKTLAKEYNVSQTTIWNIINRKE